MKGWWDCAWQVRKAPQGPKPDKKNAPANGRRIGKDLRLPQLEGLTLIVGSIGVTGVCGGVVTGGATGGGVTGGGATGGGAGGGGAVVIVVVTPADVVVLVMEPVEPPATVELEVVDEVPLVAVVDTLAPAAVVVTCTLTVGAVTVAPPAALVAPADAPVVTAAPTLPAAPL
jgi:hypothetical protein